MRSSVCTACAVVILTLSACASTEKIEEGTVEKYEAVLNSWVGQTETALVALWGPPALVYEAPDNSRMITYKDARVVSLPGRAPIYMTNVIGSTAYTTPLGGASPTIIGLYCETSFTIRGNEIITWRYEGNHCLAK